MKARQVSVAANIGPQALSQALLPLQEIKPNCLFVFADVAFFTHSQAVAALISAFPNVAIMGCSTAGEISGDMVNDAQLVISAVQFEHTHVRQACTEIQSMDDSFSAGVRVGEQLQVEGLKAVMVFGPGLAINGTALVEGITSQLGISVPITGGLAGDGAEFKQTWTLNQTGASDRGIVAIGLFGDRLTFAHGSFGGWMPFGPARKVTHCEGNVLFELDGEPALSVYKRYLGEYAKDLPSSGLLFPFEMLGEDHSAAGLIRTILGLDEEAGSLTLAGSLNKDGYLRLMHANIDGLVNGAEQAAEAAKAMFLGQGDSFALLISCVGRKLVMGELVDDEIEAVREVFGSKALLAGFYSYGEISPFAPGSMCHLHNQTMTITWLGEK